MSSRARVAVAATVAVLSAIGIGVIVTRWLSDDGGNAAPRVPNGLPASPAVSPFTGYQEVRVQLDDRCARVVVADTESRRQRGLRGAGELGPYAGMLFVQPGTSRVAFTMSGVSDPLDIAWFAANGARVGIARMRPCPQARDGEDCPLYRSPRPYLTALEVPGGHPLPQELAPC